MLWTVFYEQPKAKDTLVISLKEGLIATSKATANLVFGDLLNAIRKPEAVQRAPLTTLVTDVSRGLIALFGANSGGALRLKNWLDQAGSQTDDVFTREVAVRELREFFPMQLEVDATVYSLWALDEIDHLLKKGISNWSSRPEGVTPSTSRISIASSPTHSRPSNPYSARLSYTVRARMGQL